MICFLVGGYVDTTFFFWLARQSIGRRTTFESAGHIIAPAAAPYSPIHRTTPFKPRSFTSRPPTAEGPNAAISSARHRASRKAAAVRGPARHVGAGVMPTAARCGAEEVLCQLVDSSISPSIEQFEAGTTGPGTALDSTCDRGCECRWAWARAGRPPSTQLRRRAASG